MKAEKQFVDPIDICPVRREIMAFDGFSLCFQNGWKPVIFLSYNLNLFRARCFYS